MANPKSLDFIEGGETYRAVQIFGEGSDGNPALIGIAGDALNMRPIEGTGKTTKNRNLATLSDTYADATNLFTHTESDDVTEVVFTFTMSTPNTAIPAGASVLWAPDLLNEVSRIAAFAAVGGAAVDVEYRRINLDTTNELKYTFKGYLSDIAFLPSVAGMQVSSGNQ